MNLKKCLKTRKMQQAQICVEYLALFAVLVIGVILVNFWGVISGACDNFFTQMLGRIY